MLEHGNLLHRMSRHDGRKNFLAKNHGEIRSFGEDEGGYWKTCGFAGSLFASVRDDFQNH